MPSDRAWDYIVVGGGSAGCVLANRLSADPTVRVLLLEAGSAHRPLAMRIPALMLRMGGGYDWRYRAEDPTREHSEVVWSSGKALGGGSAVNAMQWVRGHPGDFDRWAALGCKGWDYASVLPYFRRSETFEDGADGYRGGAGPQAVSWNRVSNPMIGSFIGAATTAGHAHTPDYNGEHAEGVCRAQTSQRRGLRASTSDAYLRPVRRRRNLDILAGAFVERLLIEGGRCRGVRYRVGAQWHEAHVHREVLLSAGAIASPKLLLLSGLGPAAELRTAGIEPVLDLPGVGKNLQEQPCVPLRFRVDVRTLNQDLTPLRAMRHGLDFVFRRRGPVTTSLAHAVLFAKLDEANPVPDYEVIYFAFATMHTAAKAGDTDDHDIHAMTLPKDAMVTALPTLLHPRARGAVTLRSTNPHDAPHIEHRLWEHDEDIRTITAAAERTRAIFRSHPLAEHVLSEFVPGPDVNDSASWRNYVRSAGFGIYHASGTCKMGALDDDDAVVDPELRVRGVDGLRVIDASVMPLVTSGNTNAPTVMIAERAADLVLGDAVPPTAS